MRVLHLAAGNQYGGIERMLVSLARAGAGASIEQRFAIAFEGRLGSELEAEGPQPIRLPAARLSRPSSVRRARAALGRAISDEHVDVVICHGAWLQSVFGPAVASSGVRLVLWQHQPLTKRGLIDLLAERVHPELVVFNSRYTEACSRVLHPQAPRVVIPPPVEGAGPLNAPARRELRSALQCGEHGVVVLMAARFERIKGQDVLLAAAAQLRDLPHLRFWIAGGAATAADRRWQEEIRRRVAALDVHGPVRLLGERSDVSQLMRAADIYCQPNVGPESFGIAIVEALRAGLPVVTSGIGGALETVTADCGVLIAPGDWEGLACALRQLATDPARRQTMGQAAARRGAVVGDPDRCLRELEAALAATVPAPVA